MSLSEFTAGMVPMRRARTTAALERHMRVNGSVGTMARHAMVETCIERGYTVGTKECQRALISPEGSWFLESDITRAAVDYAEFLTRGAS